jgi:hypothetical protein
MCANGGCPLWCFRMGNDPFRDPRTMTDEQKAEAAERLRIGRERKVSAPDQDDTLPAGASIWD